MAQYAQRVSNMNSSAIREILKLASQPGMISFGGGFPAPELFPLEQVAEIAAQEVLNHGQQALQYSNTEGLNPLREKIVERMEKVYQIKGLTVDNIALLSGSQQGLDFMAKIFIDPGDVILTESPTYLGAVNAFNPYMPKFVEIAMDEDGMVMDDLREKLKQYPNAKFIYTIPDFQNPTGRTMSLERRKEMLEIVADYGVMILEDNPYGELRYEGEALPPIKAFDTQDKVVYLGSFSKVLAPGLRLAWVAATPELVRKWVVAKQSADLQCNTLSQYMINAYMDKFELSQHVEKIRNVYGARRELMIRNLETNMPEGVTWTHPKGGLFIWLTFPERVDATELLQKCLENKVAFVPGEPFFPHHTSKNNCRLNFSYVPEEKLIAGVAAMGATLKEYLKG